MLSNLVPKQYVKKIEDIDLDFLKSRGIQTLFFDADNTLLPASAGRLSEARKNFLTELKEKFGFKICLISNVIFPFKSKRIEEIASSIGAASVCCGFIGRKPHPSGFLTARFRTHSYIGQVAMVGDQILTDILGANRLGIYTILVDPLGKDSLITYLTLLRLLEIPLKKFLIPKTIDF